MNEIFKLQLENLKMTDGENMVSLYIPERNNHEKLLGIISKKILELPGNNALLQLQKVLDNVDTTSIYNGVALFADESEITVITLHPEPIVKFELYIDNKFHTETLQEMISDEI